MKRSSGLGGRGSVRALLGALWCAVAAAPALGAAAQPVDWQLPGVYDAKHASWTDALVLVGDGSFRRQSGDGGTWSFDGRTLTLHWTAWVPEQLVLRRAGRFVRKDPRFVLIRRADANVAAAPPAVAEAPAPPPGVVEVALTAREARVVGKWVASMPRGRVYRFAPDRTFLRNDGRGGRWRVNRSGLLRLEGESSGSDALHFRGLDRLVSQTRNLTLTRKRRSR